MSRTTVILATLLSLSVASCRFEEEATKQGTKGQPLTIVAVGNGGEHGGILRATGSLLTDMFTGEHDAGRCDVLLFLGNNFTEIGLNVPSGDVDGEVKDVFGPFSLPLLELGRDHVHAIPGNHDYYSRHAVEKSALFGLIRIEEGAEGLSDRGVRRETALREWSFHYGMPAEATYAAGGGAPDSVQLIFLDSALPLRTAPAAWRAADDSLRILLRESRKRPGIGWRLLCLHHPFVSVGEHAGYTEWNDEKETVERLTPCDKDSNAAGWLRNWLDPEDLCAAKYRQYLDTLKSIIRESGVTFQIALSAHDHSLQLLSLPAAAGEPGAPRVQIVSGAASRVERVGFPSPPDVFTSAERLAEKEGMSLPGFVQLRFNGDRVRVEFFSSRGRDLIDMGGGKKVFWIDKNGTVAD